MPSLFSVIPSVLLLVLTGAHFFRAGLPCPTMACLVLAALACTRRAWFRLVLLVLLPLIAARWIWMAGIYAQIRQTMGAPWHRMAVILLGVAACAVLAALFLATDAARRRYHQFPAAAPTQAAAFMLTFGMLTALSVHVPSLLLADRVMPGAGVLQALLLGLCAAYAARCLSPPKRAPVFRMRIWRIFSLVFFAQLAGPSERLPPPRAGTAGLGAASGTGGNPVRDHRHRAARPVSGHGPDRETHKEKPCVTH